MSMDIKGAKALKARIDAEQRSRRKLPDILEFDGSFAREADTHRVGWDGPWPPPKRMGIAIGNQSGVVSIFDPVSVPDGKMPEVMKVARVTIYRRVSHSTLPDNTDTHIGRLARYEPERKK